MTGGLKLDHLLFLHELAFLGLRIRYWIIIIVVILIILGIVWWSRNRAT